MPFKESFLASTATHFANDLEGVDLVLVLTATQIFDCPFSQIRQFAIASRGRSRSRFRPPQPLILQMTWKESIWS